MQTKIIVISIFAGGGAPVPQRTDMRTRKIVILIFAGRPNPPPSPW